MKPTRYLFLITFKSGNHYIFPLTMLQVMNLTGSTMIGMTLLGELQGQA